MSFYKGQDRSSWKRPRYRAITAKESDQITAELRGAQTLRLVGKDALKAIADQHELSQTTVANIAKLNGMRAGR